MKYRQFGETGLEVSILGFGAMRLPQKEDKSGIDYDKAVPMFQRALDAGVNYIDTAYCYTGSEKCVGEAVKGRRDDVIISTKNDLKLNEPKKWREMLDTSLDRLGIDCIDILHLHDLSLKSFREVFVDGGLLKTVCKAQAEGLFKHLAVSSHDRPDRIIELIDTGEFESILVQYNYLDRRNEEVIAHAAAKGLGVAVMGPLGGGRLVGPDEIDGVAGDRAGSPAAVGLSFALDNTNISVALSGMGAMEQVEENIAVAAAFDGMNAAEMKRVREMLEEKKGLADVYCTGCGYCMPCPQGVDIAEVFRLRNHRVVYEHLPASERYSKLCEKDRGPGQCVECELCIEKCPQDVDIPRQLADAHEAITGKPLELQ